MKTFFDPQVRIELMDRLLALEPGSAARWGTMDAARMLAHCTEAMKMPTGELQVKRGLPALIGWMFKRLAYDDRRFRRGAPTAREITITDPRDFEQEKAHFIVGFLKAAQGPAQITQPIHPFFGKLTNDQWGVLLYKHLDHHFRQFGV